ncbi:(S)-mandelate dehydrogenase [Roseivivax sp. THAF40]|uniref:alpha-hydroxy acid oxidase n=1 Tax=unclassified Roseivivax TaxID=2639302 RepID=UPI0012684DEA|nr:MULTISPECIES: alpha-hydroxy acid oxidase [unclassified Roseivivax]QFS84076.1 (S)-mandelate dehydrogenase [Roseivivax sp. THAF197b]QFT47903.1 (S)-mandelate dehydrogenase [Roseivivax sp. THAF40]
MSLDARYPAIADLRDRARARLPRFVWDYLDSATGRETTQWLNRAALDRLRFAPSILHGEVAPALETPLLGTDYALPFGVAPVGMSGLIWPEAERHLARAATAAGLPYTLSTVAASTPEKIGRHVAGRGWYQLYTPRDPDVRADMLARARDAGFSTLVMTVDLPAASRRERQVKGGLTQPPRLTPRLLAQTALRPTWAWAWAMQGRLPRMETLDKYVKAEGSLSSTAHVGYQLRVGPDWDYLDAVRDLWDGPLIVKGVLRAEDAPRLEAAGVDALWVSNHAGRQFDGGPCAIDVLPAIRAATELPIVFDGGIEGGLDIIRAMAMGADFIMLGRAWHYALAALGPEGPDHLIALLKADLAANLGQLGARHPKDLRGHVLPSATS